jgi:hypothetical protein
MHAVFWLLRTGSLALQFWDISVCEPSQKDLGDGRESGVVAEFDHKRNPLGGKPAVFAK